MGAVSFFFDLTDFFSSNVSQFKDARTQNAVIMSIDEFSVIFCFDSFEVLNFAQFHLQTPCDDKQVVMQFRDTGRGRGNGSKAVALRYSNQNQK
jgi:hypothetical protein